MVERNTPEVLTALKELILPAISDQHVKVYLLGSWAKGTEKNSSDIDIGIWHPSSPGPEFFAQLRDLVEESTIPYRVDIIDLVHADQAFLGKMQKEGVLWSD
ncbi:MAG: nucleotidyltransferase family protein [Desulfitobacterium sp.]